jgi:hypothetical protein
MAVLVDALIFLVALTLLGAMIDAASSNGVTDHSPETLRSYHSVMLSAELPGVDGSSMSAATLGDYLIALSLSGTLEQEQLLQIEGMVNGTLVELTGLGARAWLVIEIGTIQLHFGPCPLEEGDVHADRRELGDGSVVSTLFLA